MSARFEEVLVLFVTSVLVALFTWIYSRDRQHQSWLWLLGWFSLFLHFVFPVAAYFLTALSPLTIWVKGTTLIVAGTFFLLSVSSVYAHSRRRAAFIVGVSAVGVAYLTALTLDIQHRWLYVALMATSTLAAVWNAVRYYGWRNRYLAGMCLVFLPYVFWAMHEALTGRRMHGLNVYLCTLFATAGVLYYRHFRRNTPGVILSSISFLAWGAVFPVGTFLVEHHVGPPEYSAFWDIPKYFVAFGMILTLFENQTEVARTIAQQYRGLFEGNLAAVYVSTFEGRLLDCNAAFLQMYGFASKKEALATPGPLMYAEPAERQEFIRALDENGQVLNYECRQRRKDGTLFWILERAMVVTGAGGRDAVEGTAIDITERKNAEIALKESEERFATIFRESLVGCVIVSLEGVILNANEQALRMSGRSAEHVIGKTAVELGFWKTQQERMEFYERLRAEGRVQNLEVKFSDTAGNRHEGLFFATLVKVGERECIFGMLLDQTEKRDLEAKFLQAQKMDSLGRLAGGVAHDFNNLLGVIGGYAELLESKLGAHDYYRRYCTKILETTQRASRLTQQLLTFSRKEITRPTALRPDQLIQELSAILPRLIGEPIELAADLRSTSTVVMDKTHFEQIIFNLVINARDAMPGGGRLLIETEEIFRPSLSSSGCVEIGHYVAVRIGDTGTGMDAETLAHAFEPFYTTKDKGRGTGLGLATVYGIVQQCRGEISIDSKPGCGTRINILLPAAEVAAAIPEVSVPEPARGEGNILLVEDEISLREAHAEFLSSIGYSVKCAASGPDALSMAREPGEIDLVISDVVMPRMNGREFADQFLELRPSAKLLFVSGYADDVVLQNGISTNGTPFLQKPYSLKQLGSKVNELLRARSSQMAP
jgi:PAS domain S-box-containing protein